MNHLNNRTMAARRVLVVEDEEMVAEVVGRYLRRDGYAVEVVHDGVAALGAFAREEPDLVVLDIMLPGIDGLDVCRRIRERAATPIILLTALDREVDKVNGLLLGADDYVTKPFSPRELAARVAAVLRRGNAAATRTSAVRFGGVTLDDVARTVTLDGMPVIVTAREFDLLLHLATHAGRVFTREQLIETVWGDDFDGDADTVTVHIRRLRAKVEADPSHPAHLKTVWGVGYRLDP